MRKKPKSYLLIKLVLFVFLILIVEAGLTLCLTSILQSFGIKITSSDGLILFIFGMLMISIVLCIVAIIPFLNYASKIIDEIRNVFSEVAKGNFDANIKVPKKIKFLRDMGEDFNKMVLELKSVNILRNDFISSFSHEFKTPIVSIKGFAELLKSNKDLTIEEKNEYLQIIIDESKRLSNLSSNTLLLNRIENQSIITKVTNFCIDEQIRECVLMLSSSLQDKTIDFDVDLKPMTITTNSDLMQQVWLNVLSNAIKFTKDKITVSSETTKNNYIITVSDNGVGMDENTLKHVFIEYYKGDDSHSSSGNGLGLTIVKKILERIGGDVNISSQVGVGTTVTITIPIS